LLDVPEILSLTIDATPQEFLSRRSIKAANGSMTQDIIVFGIRPKEFPTTRRENFGVCQEQHMVGVWRPRI